MLLFHLRHLAVKQLLVQLSQCATELANDSLLCLLTGLRWHPSQLLLWLEFGSLGHGGRSIMALEFLHLDEAVSELVGPTQVDLSHVFGEALAE